MPARTVDDFDFDADAFLAALEATDPHRPAMGRRWASFTAATVALVLAHQQQRDEVTGDDEEEINAKESARNPIDSKVIEEDRYNCDSA